MRLKAGHDNLLQNCTIPTLQFQLVNHPYTICKNEGEVFFFSRNPISKSPMILWIQYISAFEMIYNKHYQKEKQLKLKIALFKK